MKTIFTILVIACLACQLSSAQSIKVGVMKSGSKEFKTSKSRTYLIVSNIDNVVDKKRKLPNELAKTGYEQYLNYKSEDLEKIKSLIKEEYVKTGRSVPKENVLINFYVSEVGNIHAMEFLLRDSTTLTIEDVRTIEDALKGKFKFNTNAKMLKGTGYVTLASVIGLGTTSQAGN